LGEVYTVPARISYNTEQMAHVGTPVSGRVAEIKVKLGDMVRKGDELLVIDSPALGEAQSEYLQKKTQVQVAQSALEVAQTAAERAKRLYEGKGIALGEYQKREGDYKAACGALKSAEAALTAAENSLHLWGISQAEISRLVKTGEIDPRYTVRAPLGGAVIKREATLGEVVGPEREALLVLADLSTLWVLADVPENTIHQIAQSAPAIVNVESLKGQNYQGKVAYIAPELDKATRTGQVRIEVPDGDTPLKPGMFAQVHLTLGHKPGETKAAMIAVPEAAVQTFEGGPCVFVEVPGEPGTFAKQAVKVGPTIGQLVPILSGLAEGKRYVAEGAFIVKAEMSKAIMEGKTCSGH
jgi:cobalt-zinc-cadmium efflux system membrane fusion protein